MIVFISGGVRSGKSDYAEERARLLYAKEQKNLIYIATSDVYDEEMHVRVKRHQEQRKRDEVNWKVYEKPSNIADLLSGFQQGDVILLDCVTTLLSNELFNGWQQGEKKWTSPSFIAEVEKKMIHLVSELAEGPYTAFVVSNELCFDLPPQDRATSIYIRLLGRIHQDIVSRAKEAVLIENRLVLLKKRGGQA
ncbi:bifunctional adenosylcobinamide kinase/adenosylcobinamide-phosphate guanylyltransferase [Halalkalibacter krulwichiae]|uniref:bifunctional adenosylcobinamide kinase/adenosylcobinamide-phosphate guanylyltransferase n=1 Tax=Halalkalibacter krulwichiae TaxID=199441 RepID=UPI0008241BD2|nr:bifunctional adenosylcobinamide kinase/adenosylcobinamide-phosphate guanylyltransferase [Halalkalibacter krulwichiae]